MNNNPSNDLAKLAVNAKDPVGNCTSTINPICAIMCSGHN